MNTWKHILRTNVVSLSSKQNPFIQTLARLREKRALRDEKGVFLVEGYRELSRVFDTSLSPSSSPSQDDKRNKQRFSIEEIYFCPQLFGEPKSVEVMQLLYNLIDEKAVQEGVRVFEVSEDVFKKVSYRQGPDGVLAVVKNHYHHYHRGASDITDVDVQLQISSSQHHMSLSKHASFFLIVQGIEKPGNLGALFRNVDFFGGSGVLICDPVCEVFNPNVIRASQGSAFSVPFAVTSSSQALQYMESKGITPYITVTSKTQNEAKDNVRSLYDMKLTENIGIIMGSEAYGVSEAFLNDPRCTKFLTIPKNSHSTAVDSLNVSTATAAILSEMVRQRLYKS